MIRVKDTIHKEIGGGTVFIGFYHQLEIVDNGSGEIKVNVVSGLDKLKNSRRTIIDYSGKARVKVNGKEQMINIEDGTGSVKIPRDARASETVEIEAMTLSDVPAEPDRATIEVVE